MRRFPVRLLLASLLVLGSCTLVPTTSPAPPAGPSAAPGTYAVVDTAYRAIIERHVDKPSSKTLLDVATRELRAAIPGLAAASRADDLQYTGNADGDLTKFKSLLDRAVQQGPKTQAQIERLAVTSMAKSLDDCHTYYVDPDRAPNYIPREGERYSGIGATIVQPRPNTDRLPEITIVFPNSPADRAGVKAGDKIRSVNETNVAGLTAEEVANMIRGPEGTQVQLVLVRPSGERSITITRASLRVPTVLEQSVDDFGLILIAQLATNVPNELAAALGRLDQAGVKGWILDLRGNSGGDFVAAQLVASTFVRDGAFVYEVGRDGQERPLNYNPKAYFQHQKPLAVLVSRGSASGAELIAASIQEHHAGRIFGDTTVGCFSEGQVRELPDGGILLVKVVKLRSGVTRQDFTGTGITPDERITTSPDDEGDRVLTAAIAWLKTQTP